MGVSYLQTGGMVDGGVHLAPTAHGFTTVNPQSAMKSVLLEEFPLFRVVLAPTRKGFGLPHNPPVRVNFVPKFRHRIQIMDSDINEGTSVSLNLCAPK